MTDDEMEALLTRMWSSKTDSQRASLDGGDWEQGAMDAIRAMEVDAKSNNPTVWARVQWGGASEPAAEIPTHISTYKGIQHSAMRPRWVRAVMYGSGEAIATPWVAFTQCAETSWPFTPNDSQCIKFTGHKRRHQDIDGFKWGGDD